MHSYGRCLLHLRSRSLRRDLFAHAQALSTQIHRHPPRISFTSFSGFHPHFGSSDESAEADEETKRDPNVSVNQVDTSNGKVEEKEEEVPGRTIRNRSSKQKGKKENTENPKFSSNFSGQSGKVKGGDEVSEAPLRSWLLQKAGSAVPKTLAEANKGRNQSEWRIPLSGPFGMEVSRVLGGGVVPGSLVLVGGEPGAGKSTLLLQVAAVVAEGLDSPKTAPVVYVSGEESIEQIANRADRMHISTDNLLLYSSTDVEDILHIVQQLRPRAVIIDSIQTVYMRGVTGSAGNVRQVKECTSAFLRFAKKTNIPIFLIGHVTKSGGVAGPRFLEHIVDAVLYIEGERYLSYRILRSTKNRFGSTDELGLFEMSEMGLQVVTNPSKMFLQDQNMESEILAGSAIAVLVDKSRAFVIEVQALCVPGFNGIILNGIKNSRAAQIISVLQKQACVKLHGTSPLMICVNVIGAIQLSETAGDLAVAAAIYSSFQEYPIPNDVAFIGEIGLGGELRMVPRMDKRVMAVAKLGYKRCVVPKSAEKLLAALDIDMTILGCNNLRDMICTVFQSKSGEVGSHQVIAHVIDSR